MESNLGKVIFSGSIGGVILLFVVVSVVLSNRFSLPDSGVRTSTPVPKQASMSDVTIEIDGSGTLGEEFILDYLKAFCKEYGADTFKATTNFKISTYSTSASRGESVDIEVNFPPSSETMRNNTALAQISHLKLHVKIGRAHV